LEESERKSKLGSFICHKNPKVNEVHASKYKDPFNSDVVLECYLTSSSPPPSNPVHRLQDTINELQSATPERVLSKSQLQKTLDMLQGNSEDPPTTPSICQTAKVIPTLQRPSLTTPQDVFEAPVSTTPVQWNMPNSTTQVLRSPPTTLHGELTEVAQ